MADQKLTELDEETSPAGTDLVYVVTDPDGTPTSKKVKIGNLPGGSRIDAVDSPAYASVVAAADSGQNASATSFAGDGAGGEATLAADVSAGNASIEAELADIGSRVKAFQFALHEGDLSAGFFNADPFLVPIQINSGDTLENRVAALEAALVALGLLEDTA